MQVKTLTGPSIQAALAEARRQFGDEVVLLESVAAQGESPARITIVMDGAPKTAAPDPEPARVPFGYAAAQPTPRVGAQQKPGQGRGRLFPEQRVLKEENAGTRAARSPVDSLEDLLATQNRALNERLERLERTFGGALIGASQRWAAHPLFAHLLQTGMRPETTTRLFDAIASKGHHPDKDIESLRWALTSELRKLIERSAPSRMSGSVVFIGPGGAGKTSLLLKTAKHNSLFGRRRVAAVIIPPEEQENTDYRCPSELYARYKIPAFTARTPEEMHLLMQRLQTADHVLIDTPPLPAREAAGRKVLTSLRRMLDGILPLSVVLVLDTVRALDEFDPSVLTAAHLQPEALALTHLDETLRWGRVAEWIAQVGLPVQFASVGRRVPDDIVAFSPGWFVEELMKP